MKENVHKVIKFLESKSFTRGKGKAVSRAWNEIAWVKVIGWDFYKFNKNLAFNISPKMTILSIWI
jgi:hypothetical protein